MKCNDITTTITTHVTRQNSEPIQQHSEASTALQSSPKIPSLTAEPVMIMQYEPSVSWSDKWSYYALHALGMPDMG